MIRKHFLVVLVSVLFMVNFSLQAQSIRRVSVSSAGDEGNQLSDDCQMSGDGRYVVFRSGANNLVSVDTNLTSDIFLRDNQTGETRMMSVNESGEQGFFSPLGHGAPNDGASLNRDGRYVIFQSISDNFVANDTNVREDIFLRDNDNGTVERVSIKSNGDQGNGNSVVFGAQCQPSRLISDDGRYVAFSSLASNFVEGDINGGNDVFVHDRQTNKTEIVSVNDAGEICGGLVSGISGNGRYVVFESPSANLVPDDTNNDIDIFVHDRQTDKTERVSVNNDGEEANWDSFYAEISGDGRYVVFQSNATNLVPGDVNNEADVFVYDRQTDKIELISKNADGVLGNNYSAGANMSWDGRFVVFISRATNLLPFLDSNGSIRDVFIYDRLKNTMRVVVNDSGAQANADCTEVTITDDGKYVAFYSTATNLVSNDNNGTRDVFVYYDPCNDVPPDITVKSVVDPENADYIKVNINADADIDCATAYFVVKSHSRPDEPVTVDTLSKVDARSCEGTYHRSQGFGDVATITAYVYDVCGNLGVSDGTFERDVISGKPVIIAHNRIDPARTGDKTTIQYQLAQSGPVQIEIFDQLGQLVKTLVDEQAESGKYQVTWDGRDSQGIIVASGIYFITVRTNEYTVKENIVVIK